MAACSAISRTRSATDCGSMIVAQIQSVFFQAHRPKVCAPLAQKKKWAKTHRTNPKIRASCGLYEKDRAEASEGQTRQLGRFLTELLNIRILISPSPFGRGLV